MSKNIFKIYDGRTNFWQWDTNQRLIVLDEDVDQVHYSNRNMNYTIINRKNQPQLEVKNYRKKLTFFGRIKIHFISKTGGGVLKEYTITENE